MTRLHLINTRIGYILCMINVGLSFSIYLLKTFFDKMPVELEDAARIDGCSKIGIWWNVAQPLLFFEQSREDKRVCLLEQYYMKTKTLVIILILFIFPLSAIRYPLYAN